MLYLKLKNHPKNEKNNKQRQILKHPHLISADVKTI